VSITRNVVLRAVLSGAGIGLVCSLGALLSLLAFRLDAPWSPFIPGFLLLGATGLVVATVALYAERSALSVVAFGCALLPLAIFLVWLYRLPQDALS
jgi:hypothetical protein